MCQYLYRTGGQAVFVCPRYPQGVTAQQYRQLLLEHKVARRWHWSSRVVNAGVYVRGRISHADHKTVVLNDWHQVVMNTERLAPGAQNVVFLD
jgi:hypothetical protein